MKKGRVSYMKTIRQECAHWIKRRERRNKKIEMAWVICSSIAMNEFPWTKQQRIRKIRKNLKFT